MKQDRTESFESPLDEVLENVPQEDPPEGLEQRCLDALGDAAGESRPSHPNWWLPVRNVIAVAAGLILVVGAVHLVGPGVLGETERVLYESMEAPPADRGPSREYAVDSEPVSDMAPPAEESVMAESAGPAGPAGSAGPMAARRMESAAEQIAPRGDAADIISAPRPPVDAARPRAPEVDDPWRDFSGERQVITTKELDLEVGDVESAYDSARAVVDRHGGFVAGDRVEITDDRADVATLTIRLPVERFEAAISDLRQLGEVIRLVGESVDVTEQYYEGGAHIREKADREQRLVEQIEAESNAQRKRQLQAQLDQLRREMEREKAILSRLAEQTHWPVLELTLTEASGPGEFLSRTLRGSLSALAWVGATAIIWVPLVVLLTLFWRRLIPVRPSQ